MPLEQRCRNQPPVGDEHDRLGVERIVQALDDGKTELHRLELRGRRPEAAASAGRCVGLGEDERDLVIPGEPLENVRAEWSAGGEADTH